MACSSCGYTPCGCATPSHSFNWNLIPDESCDPCSTDPVCRYTFPARCVMYNGPALTCLGLGSNVNLDLVIASIHSIICTLLGSEICNAPSALEVVHTE
jgi:hypothetical protein